MLLMMIIMINLFKINYSTFFNYFTTDLFHNDNPSATQEAAWFEAIGNITLSKEEISTVIDRLGQLVLGIKTLFDSRSDTKTGRVSDKEIPGIF